MSRQEKKDKRQYQKIKEEWIEMEDLNAVQNQNLAKNLADLEKPTRDISLQNTDKPNLSVPPTIQKPLPQTNLSYPSLQNAPPKPVPVKRKIEGSLPMMQVKCDYCTVSQRVPGNTQVFCCGSCDNLNECYPLYGLFLCGCCSKQVGFGFGMHQFIKCPQCSSVNRVPLEPIKQYQSIPIRSEAPRRPEPEKREGEREERFRMEKKEVERQKRAEKRELEVDNQFPQFDEENISYVGVQYEKREQI